MTNGKILLLIIAAVPVLLPFKGETGIKEQKEVKKMELKLSAPFAEGGMIPARFTCDGENVSPGLEWKNEPSGTKSLALICDDPDAPAGDWVHWIVFNIPPGISLLKEEASSGKLLPAGASEGKNDFGRTGYGGPCPPSGIHRYFFKLYALDCSLSPQGSPTKKMLLEAMKDHILAQTALYGRYKRK